MEPIYLDMYKTSAQRFVTGSTILMLGCALLARAQANPTAVRYIQGSVHGFLELRSEDGHLVASGDSTQTVRGGLVTAETVFRFRDGSIDDETATYTQRRTFQLVRYHHIQKGPAFPHPVDMSIDVPSGQVTIRTQGKDGKEDVDTQRMKLPLDLANGIVPQVIENLGAGAVIGTASMVVATPKARLVKLEISPSGEDNVSVAGSSRKASHYEIKIDLGGVAGVVAPILGKEPPKIQLWVIRGLAPTFAKEVGPMYTEGPMMTIQLASPVWPER